MASPGDLTGFKFSMKIHALSEGERGPSLRWAFWDSHPKTSGSPQPQRSAESWPKSWNLGTAGRDEEEAGGGVVKQ